MGYKSYKIKKASIVSGLLFVCFQMISQNEALFTPMVKIFPPGVVPTLTVMINTDVINNLKLATIVAENAIRGVSLESVEKKMDDTIDNYDFIIDKKYSKNKKFSDNKGYRLKSAALVAMGLTTLGVSNSRVNRIKYAITKNKKEFMNEIQKANLLLIGLQNLDYKKMSVDERQEIYRHRNELINIFFNYNKVNRDLLALPAAKFVIKNSSDLLAIYGLMEISNINVLPDLLNLKAELNNNTISKGVDNISEIMSILP